MVLPVVVVAVRPPSGVVERDAVRPLLVDERQGGQDAHRQGRQGAVVAVGLVVRHGDHHDVFTWLSIVSLLFGMILSQLLFHVILL